MPSASEQKTSWVTRDEIRFLKRLGRWTAIRDRSEDYMKRRKRLLEGYLMAMRLRQRWGEVDKDEVEKYIKRK